MRRVQIDYSRRFNRARRRDGPLVRGRYCSKPVTSDEYQRILVRYIDGNSVRAEMAARAAEYPHGSAFWFARTSGPPWHTRAWVEQESCRASGLEPYEPWMYDQAFPPSEWPRLQFIVERRLNQPAGIAPGADLLELASGEVREWMKRKAALGDGTRPGLAVLDPESIDRAVERKALLLGTWTIRRGRQERSGWPVVRAGILRDLTGSTWSEIALRLDCASAQARRLAGLHARLLQEDEEYERRAVELVEGLRGAWGT